MTRCIRTIAREIALNWPKPFYGAVPYLRAMQCIDDVHDDYGADTGRSIVLYFLSNATTWRGDVARRIKAELKEMLK